jgi:hypothetical protein
MEKINVKNEMVYTDLQDIQGDGVTILADGEYNEHEFKIISYGTHPCCYIKLNPDEKYYGKSDDDILLPCHGGVTFAKMTQDDDRFENGFWIGWDYAHFGDAFGEKMPGRMYTTQTLLAHTKAAIDELNTL